MELELDYKLNAQPGQFVEIQLSDPSDSQYRLFDYDDSKCAIPRSDAGPDLRDRQPFLNRPFSIAANQTNRQRSQITVIYNVKGPGTEKLDAIRSSSSTLSGDSTKITSAPAS